METKRFKQSRQGVQFPSEFDFSTQLLDDLKLRNVAPVYVLTLNLAVAGAQAIPVPARGFVPYFYQTGSAIKLRVTNGLLTAYPNQDDASNTFFALPCAHNRGFIGSVAKTYITWTAQPGVSVDIVFHRSNLTPWMTDDILGGASNTPGLPSAVIPVSANTTIAVTYGIILVTAGSPTVTLPNPSTWTGLFIIKNAGVNPLIQCAAGNIDGAPTYPFPNFLDAITLFSDGTNAWIV